MNILHVINQQVTTTPNATVTPLATPSLGAEEVSVIKQRMEPGHQNPAHTQNREEVMVMLRGNVIAQVALETHELQAGAVLTIPAHTPHSLKNLGPDDAEWLIISPAGTQFYGAAGQLMTPEWAK